MKPTKRPLSLNSTPNKHPVAQLRHTFNLSVAELDDGIVWNRATLGIASISSSTNYLTGQLQQIDQAAHRIAATLSAEIVDSYAEILTE